MGMGVMGQGLAPGVENSDHAGLGTEMLGVGADETDRVGCRFEQDVVDDGLVLQRDGGHVRRFCWMRYSWYSPLDDLSTCPKEAEGLSSEAQKAP